MKIELVSIHIKKSPQAMPLAAAMLKATLDAKEETNHIVTTSLSDFYTNQQPAGIAKQILTKNPDMVGFSLYLWNVEQTHAVAALIKKEQPNITLFAGGAEVTANPLNILKSDLFDFIIKGEGENALAKVVNRLLKKKSIDDIPGVFLRQTPHSALLQSATIDDLNRLPSPFLTGALSLEKYEGVLWELSRGCPFKCSFCFESRGVAKVRTFSLDRIKKELELFEKSGVVQIFVLDATFNFDRTRAKKILKIVRDTAPFIHFIFEVRTEFIDRELARLFSSLNCSLQIGLQSSDATVLSNVNRPFNSKKFREKISLLNNFGAVFGLDLIYGLPEDSLKGFKKSLDYAITLQPNNIDIFPLSVFPGTLLFEQTDRFQLTCLPRAPYTVLFSPHFPKEDMQKAKELADATDIFYNKGRAVGWLFMILESVKISPSDFFTQFSRWKFSPKESILEVQCAFTKEIFKKYNKSALYPPMEDIMRYHHSLSASLDAGHPKISEKKRKIDNTTILKLSSSTRFLSLHYDLDDLLHIGEVTLITFVKQVAPIRSDVITYNYRGEAMAQPLDSQWIRLLKTVDGKSSLEQVLKKVQMEKDREIVDFIEFCIESEIVLI